MGNQILFICTGNFYRSRFAEAVFNHSVAVRALPWRAFSRGLATHLVADCGPISLHTVEALSTLNICLSNTSSKPCQLSREDLEEATRVIALKETEHRAMIEAQFADWKGPIEYWNVHDLDMAGPDQALSEIQALVGTLVDELDVVASG